jgi:hypothetical protein
MEYGLPLNTFRVAPRKYPRPLRANFIAGIQSLKTSVIARDEAISKKVLRESSLRFQDDQ